MYFNLKEKHNLFDIVRLSQKLEGDKTIVLDDEDMGVLFEISEDTSSRSQAYAKYTYYIAKRNEAIFMDDRIGANYFAVSSALQYSDIVQAQNKF